MNDEVYLHGDWIILICQSLFTGKWGYEVTHKTWKDKCFYAQNFLSEESALMEAKNEIDKQNKT